MTADIKTAEQIKIALAATRLHGHILAWVLGFMAGFLFWFWFGLSPRPETQIALIEYGFASLLNWLGALSWLPRLQWVYSREVGLDLFPYFVGPLIAGFIAAAASLLARLFILGRLAYKPLAIPEDRIMRGASKSAHSTQNALDRMKD